MPCHRASEPARSSIPVNNPITSAEWCSCASVSFFNSVYSIGAKQYNNEPASSALDTDMWLQPSHLILYGQHIDSYSGGHQRKNRAINKTSPVVGFVRLFAAGFPMLHLYGLFIIDQRDPFVKPTFDTVRNVAFPASHQTFLYLWRRSIPVGSSISVRSDPLFRMTK